MGGRWQHYRIVCGAVSDPGDKHCTVDISEVQLVGGRYRSSDPATDKAQIAQATVDVYGLPGISPHTAVCTECNALSSRIAWFILSGGGELICRWKRHTQSASGRRQQGASPGDQVLQQPADCDGDKFFLTRWQYALQGYNTLIRCSTVNDIMATVYGRGGKTCSRFRTTLMLSQSWGGIWAI